MKIGRREFVGMVGATLGSISASGLGYHASAAETPQTVEKNGWQLKVSPTGEIISLRDGQMELVNRKLGDNHPRVMIMYKKGYTCNQPTSLHRQASAIVYRYAFSDEYTFALDYEIELVDLSAGNVALKQRVVLDCPRKLSESVKLVLPLNIQLPFENRTIFVPLKNGVGRRKPIGQLDNDDEYLFRFAGFGGFGKPQLLAIPMLDESSQRTNLHLTHCVDPFFTSRFRLPHGDKIGQFYCVYVPQVGLQGREERTFYTGLHRGDAKMAMQVFYETVLAEVKPGPDWLHDVAMVDYDFLSKNGQGWFADIDKLQEVIEPRDRSKVFLALHGWYDSVGRYTFDLRSGSLDKEWTAFPSARDPAVQNMGLEPDAWEPFQYHKASVQAMQPVRMSIEALHRRIRYAKDKGFRVGLYFADGLNSSTGAKNSYDQTKVLSWGGWTGPDTIGKVFGQNPLHPEVRRFYTSYTQALLNEYGKELDGLIWDETHIINPGTLGTESYPGYADRALMTLIKEVTALVANFSTQVALLASDNIGLSALADKSPNCLVAHGTYQDSACRPEVWPYGLFPNYRNTLWSCNWSPVSCFDSTKYGVETFDVPVAISNGAFGDDIGVSDMGSRDLRKFLELFEKRKQRRMVIGWIEESPPVVQYGGRDVAHKWSL